MTNIDEIMKLFGRAALSAVQFRAEEDGAPYSVWKVETPRGPAVLKKTTARERETYETFFPDGGGAPKVYGFAEFRGEAYMLMEYVEGQTMSRCDRHRLTLTLNALIAMQARFWEDRTHEAVGYGFSESWPNRQKRLAYMGDLTAAYQAYLDAFRTVPRTLCNDDLLPFNVLADEHRAVIIDWEYGGILPWPSAIARLLAFGEEDPDAMFQMSREDQRFAVDYYYENLVSARGIGYGEYIRTLKLFFLKEYSEWVYCAASSGDFSGPYYEKYYKMAKNLAKDLGF